MPPHPDSGSDSDSEVSSSSDDDVTKDTPKPAPSVDEDLPALFWDTLPQDASNNPDFLALEALKEECTPEERAETFKVNGNKKLQVGLKARNKVLLREAIQFYTQGLQEKCSDTKLNAVLLSNRSHVESLLGNWRKALEDALESHTLDPANVKALFRAARAAVKLGRHQQALDLVAKGREVDPGAKEFNDIEKEAKSAIERSAAEAAAAAAKEEAALAPARALADAVLSRGIRVTLPQVRAENESRPTLNPDGSLTWPVLILYPEGMQQDVIQAAGEEDTIAQHLDEMFGPQAPPLEFDTQHEYTRDQVELYYLSNAGKPLSRDQLVQVFRTGNWPQEADAAGSGPSRYGASASTWVRVKESWTLAQLLTRPDHVVPGVPLLFALAKGTDYRQRFLEKGRQ